MLQNLKKGDRVRFTQHYLGMFVGPTVRAKNEVKRGTVDRTPRTSTGNVRVTWDGRTSPDYYLVDHIELDTPAPAAAEPVTE